MKIFARFIFPFLLLVLVSLLCLANFSQDTYLTGWDNLQIELDFGINLERSFNTVWQEYQGLGLLGGMGHGADLLRQLFLWPFSLVLEKHLLRYLWNFTALLVGAWGLYALALDLINRSRVTATPSRLLAFLGASFYVLNIGTVQNFYPNYDPFAAFFAFLPWLLWSLWRYLAQNSRRNLLFFALFSLLGTTFAYVQTIFVVYLLLLVVTLLAFLLSHRKKIASNWQTPLKVLAVVFLSNAFWLLPVVYFTVLGSDTTVTAKSNLMSTGVTFLQNNRFGNFFDVATMKGYWFAYTDFDRWGNMVYLLDAWKSHFYQPLVVVLSWLYFLLLLVGFGALLIHRQKRLGAIRLSIIFTLALIVFILLGSNPPFGFIYDFLRESVPLFGQIFRSSFTKWVVPFSLFYSLLLTFGLAFIFALVKRRWLQWLLGLVFFVSLIFYSWPAFQGHFFYERLRVEMPQAYFAAFDYFRHEAPVSSRIANLPQHSFYGWQWNDWGYRGSGFLWYGIKQPILDRAFDVWSTPLEGYYWELQYALDQKDVGLLEQVWHKYDVDYVLLDTSVVNRNTSKPFNYAALQELLQSSAQLELIREWDFLQLYEVGGGAPAADFVSLYEQAPLIHNSYRHSWQDQAFTDFGDYLSWSTQDAAVIYPFASQFTNHRQTDLEFLLTEDDDFFYLQSQADILPQDFNLLLPDFPRSSFDLPFLLSWELQGQQLQLTLTAKWPEVLFGDKRYYYDFKQQLTLDTTTCLRATDCQLNINNQLFGPLTQAGELPVLLHSRLPNTLALSTADSREYFAYQLFEVGAFTLSPRELTLSTSSPSLLVKIPKLSIYDDLLGDPSLNQAETKTCRPMNDGSFYKELRSDGNYYQATGTSACDHFYLADLPHPSAYLWRLDAQNLASLPFVFAIQSATLGRSPLETYLDDGVNYQILPPTEDFHRGYTMYLSTDSYGRETNRNLLTQAQVFAWPYRFLSELKLTAQTAAEQAAVPASCDAIVQKRALWLYQVDVPAACNVQYLKLSQAYDQGWLAVSQWQLLPHYKWNNWANVWQLQSTDAAHTVYVFFWPQLLQYLGFGLLLAGFYIVIRKK